MVPDERFSSGWESAGRCDCRCRRRWWQRRGRPSSEWANRKEVLQRTRSGDHEHAHGWLVTGPEDDDGSWIQREVPADLNRGVVPASLTRLRSARPRISHIGETQTPHVMDRSIAPDPREKANRARRDRMATAVRARLDPTPEVRRRGGHTHTEEPNAKSGRERYEKEERDDRREDIARPPSWSSAFRRHYEPERPVVIQLRTLFRGSPLASSR